MPNDLTGWNIKEEQQKADFLDHIYNCYKPGNGLYTGLWKRFCLEEAGPYCRNIHFERMEALQKFIEEQENSQNKH
jgi:hypothetical protein